MKSESKPEAEHVHDHDEGTGKLEGVPQCLPFELRIPDVAEVREPGPVGPTHAVPVGKRVPRPFSLRQKMEEEKEDHRGHRKKPRSLTSAAAAPERAANSRPRHRLW